MQRAHQLHAAVEARTAQAAVVPPSAASLRARSKILERLDRASVTVSIVTTAQYKRKYGDTQWGIWLRLRSTRGPRVQLGGSPKCAVAVPKKMGQG